MSSALRQQAAQWLRPQKMVFSRSALPTRTASSLIAKWVLSQVWNPSFLLETSQQAHEGIALCCTASADGQYIYTGGNDGTIKVWYSSQDAIASSLQSAALQGEAESVAATAGLENADLRCPVGRLFTLLAEFIKYRSVSSDHGCREEVKEVPLLRYSCAYLTGSTPLQCRQTAIWLKDALGTLGADATLVSYTDRRG